MSKNSYINVANLGKTYKRPVQKDGFKGAIKSLLSTKYEYIHALNQVSFSIDEGETVAYLGPNGSGKSTTIKLLCGILSPSNGTCTIAGRCPWKDRINHVANLGVVFGQRTQLWWDIPVADSFRLLKDIYRIPHKGFQARLERLVEILGIENVLSSQVRTLSLGQRMRCELAASLLHGPKLLILDEPTIGLDINAKQKTYSLLKQWNREYGTTMILTTHDLSDVEALCNRAILLASGNIIFDGKISQLRSTIGTIKRVQIELTAAADLPSIDGVRILKNSSTSLHLEVDTTITSIKNVLSECCKALPIEDISVQYPPLEDAILSFF